MAKAAAKELKVAKQLAKKLAKHRAHKKAVKAKKAVKEAKLKLQAKLDKKAKELIEVLKINPFEVPPKYEKLSGDLQGAYSRRINIQHRVVYQVFEDEEVVISAQFMLDSESRLQEAIQKMLQEKAAGR